MPSTSRALSSSRNAAGPPALPFSATTTISLAPLRSAAATGCHVGVAQSAAVATLRPLTNTVQALSHATTSTACAAGSASANDRRSAIFAPGAASARSFDQIHRAVGGDGGGVSAAAAVTTRTTSASPRGGAVPVSCHTASVNCSAVIRRGSGPTKSKSPTAGASTAGVTAPYASDVAIVSSTWVTLQSCVTSSAARMSSSSALHGAVRSESTGCTMPRPMSRCHSRLTSVRESQPLAGSVTRAASCRSRSARGAAGSTRPSSLKSQPGVAFTPVALSQRCSSSGASAATAASS